MARNIARHTTSNDEPQDETTGEIRQVPGGSPGVASLVTTPVLPGTMTRATVPSRDEPSPARQYEVLATRDVVYDHQRTTLKQGRVVSETSCDVQHLRRQGVQLREILPVKPPESVPQDGAPVQATGEIA